MDYYSQSVTSAEDAQTSDVDSEASSSPRRDDNRSTPSRLKNLNALLDDLQRQLRDRHLRLPSGYEMHAASETSALSFLASYLKTFKLITHCSHAALNQQSREIDFILEQLSEAKSTPIESRSWQDAVESWLALRDLLPEVHSFRCRCVLECVFAPRDVRRAVALGQHLRGIKSGATELRAESTPTILLNELKGTLGGHMKQNFFEYRAVLEEERARVRRVMALQERGVAACGALVCGCAVGVTNFCFSLWWAGGGAAGGAGGGGGVW